MRIQECNTVYGEKKQTKDRQKLLLQNPFLDASSRHLKFYEICRKLPAYPYQDRYSSRICFSRQITKFYFAQRIMSLSHSYCVDSFISSTSSKNIYIHTLLIETIKKLSNLGFGVKQVTGSNNVGISIDAKNLQFMVDVCCILKVLLRQNFSS